MEPKSDSDGFKFIFKINSDNDDIYSSKSEFKFAKLTCLYEAAILTQLNTFFTVEDRNLARL